MKMNNVKLVLHLIKTPKKKVKKGKNKDDKKH